MAGAPVSDLVQVDRANSIEGRLTGLLGGLQGSWREFYDGGQPVWEKMVAIGHSQGSGHAAYLGKQHRLRGVIMLAGPQDTGAAGPAPWLSRPGATPGPRYQAFLHKDDTFGCAQQLEAVRLLRGGDAPPEAVVVADEPVSDAHMSVIQDHFKAVWRQLLQSTQH